MVVSETKILQNIFAENSAENVYGRLQFKIEKKLGFSGQTSAEKKQNRILESLTFKSLIPHFSILSSDDLDMSASSIYCTVLSHMWIEIFTKFVLLESTRRQFQEIIVRKA